MFKAGRHPRSFRFRDLADLGKFGAGVLRREIEHLLDDPRDRFAMAIGNRQQPEIIAFSQERVRRRHETAGDDRAAANGQQIRHHQHDENDRNGEERHHDRPSRNQRIEKRFGPGQIGS